ncbi:hypothetical protein [Chelatococcus reniformis]|uniref:Uncharacterized protein n=1 Tax=Chelatococcus reniformis TaxID=1494448 RepID=A0A916UEC7_9HYPH|nr:hypothetical protein [Chelatococcus reniformis]GGC69269.1 hypothetical protein GCM10010994_29800 [Chelatococcus reniformis]
MTASPPAPSGTISSGWRPRRRAVVLLATTALAGLVAAGGAWWSAYQVHTALGGLGARAGSVIADPLSGRVRLTDVVSAAGGFRMRAGAISLQGGFALVPAAAAADPLIVNDVTVDAGDLAFRIPRIEVSGGSVSEQDLRGLFAKDDGDKLGSRLARLSASRIAMPSVTVESRHAGETGTVVYRDIVLTGVTNGVVASATASGGTVEGGTSASRVKGTFGPVSVQGADMPVVARFYTETSDSGATPLTTAYASFALDSLQLTTGDDVEVGIQKIAGSDIKLRPPTRPFSALMAQMGAAAETAKASDTAAQRSALAELLQSLAVGSIELLDTTVDDPDKHAETPKPTRGRIARATFAGSAAAHSMAFADIQLMPPDGRLTVGSLSYEGSFLDGRSGAPASGQSAATAIALRGTTIKMADLVADLPNDSAPTERLRFGLKSSSVVGSQPVDGVPAAWTAAVDHVTFALPSTSADDSIKTLIAMGYKTVDLSGTTDFDWRPATQELKLDNLTLSGADMATVKLGGVLGNVGKDIFSGDEALVQVALAGATVKSLSLSLADRGLANRLLARQADQEGKTPEDLRKAYGSAAAIIIPGFLGGSPQARTLGNAVARFIAKPGLLEITATARDPQGLGAADFMAAAGNPSNLLEQLDIKATAN